MQAFDRNTHGALRLKARTAVLTLALGLAALPFAALAEDAAAVDPAAAEVAAPLDAMAPMGDTGSAAPVAAALPSSEAMTEAGDASSTEAATTTEEVANPYGLAALWNEGDWVSKFVLAMLAVMSLASWYIIVVRVIDQTAMLKNARTAIGTFWESANLHEGLQKLEPNSAFRTIAEAGLKAADSHAGTLKDKIDRSNAINMSLSRAVGATTKDMQGGLSFLATVGSVSPFVGLFGTVWGIYHALIAIGIAGQASIDKVAGPVGEALIMTAIGLAVAVPAVLGYNALLNRNKTALDHVRHFSADIEQVLLARGH